MRRPGQKQRRIVILLLTILTFGIAYYGGNKYTEDEPPKISGVLLRPAVPVPQFKLRDQYESPFTLKQFEDHWSLVLLDPMTFSDPPALLSLVRIHNRLAIEPAIQQQTRFVYIPRKPISTTETFAQGLGSNFFSLSGEAVDLNDTFSRFGISGTDEGYTLYLVDPDTRLHALFTASQDAATIASDLISLITAHRN